MLPVHVLGGGLALVFGYLALYAAKGSTLHRRSGMAFVFAMVLMSLSGALMAVLNDTPTSVVAGLMTFYMVMTGLLTVRRRTQEVSWIDRGATLYALIVSLLCFNVGIESVSRGRPEGVPMFIFGSVGLLAAAGDIRAMRAGGIDGPRRIARHLWRMCFGMWVAAASFFWGPPGRVPELIRIPALLAIAVLIPIGAMVYWLWRLRARRTIAPGEARPEYAH